MTDEVKNEFSQFLKKSINEAREETLKATENGEKFTEESLNQFIQSVARVYVFAKMDVITELFSGLIIESFAPLIKKIFISVYNDKMARVDQKEYIWRRIESAPMSSKQMILLANLDTDGTVLRAEQGCWDFIENSDWDGAPVFGWTTTYGSIDEPSHWMYLPPVEMIVGE